MTGTRRRLVAALGALLTIACAINEWNIDLGHRVDFRVYHRAIRSIDGKGLYRYGVGNEAGFTYPPFAAVVLRPITWLGETVASHVWLLVSIALAFAVFWVLIGLIDDGGPVAAHRPVVVGVCLWAYPIHYTFRLGQINPLIVTLLAVDIVLMSRNRRAGLGTGLAAALKVTPLAMVGFLLVARPRDGLRALGAFLGATAFAALVLPSETRQYWTDKLFDTGRVGPAGGGRNVSLKSVVIEIVPTGTLQTVAWAVVSVGLIVVAAVRIRRIIDVDPVGAFVVGMCCSYAVSPITWTHHLWFAVLALIVWAVRASRPFDGLIIGLGALGLLNPFGLDETSMVSCTMTVAFIVLVIVALPVGSNSPEVGPTRPPSQPDVDRAELAREPLASPMM